MSDTNNTVELTELQKEIFDKISNNKTEELKTLLAANKIKIDFLDETNMTPLLHASFKGNKEMVQMLLDHGADPKKCLHKQKYTALHFAALSGNAEVCHLLMMHGAQADATNSIHRTPSQIAAFVGNHNCVSIINNFLPKSYLDYYTKPRGLQNEPLLHPHLVESFYAFTMQINLHPVRVIMNLQKLPGLLDNLPMVKKVLESLSQRLMTKSSDTYEVLSFKYHYLSCIVAAVIDCQKQQSAIKSEKSENEKKSDAIELLIKKFIKTKGDGKADYLELFVRESVRGYPYRDSCLFQRMIAVLATPSADSAISYIHSSVNGPQMFKNYSQVCVTCMEDKALKVCSKCKMVQYCDRECQRLHWFLHKKECNRTNQSNTLRKKVPEPEPKPDSTEIVDALTRSMAMFNKDD